MPTGGDDFEITAAQKMISAMSGSLFTSLLGTFHLCKHEARLREFNY
jgi:hypothetical protein